MTRKIKSIQWPCKIDQIPPNAPYFEDANLLIAADCAAFAYSAFHQDFIKNHVTVSVCGRSGDTDYYEKLVRIIKENNVKSVKVVIMDVGCCEGVANLAKRAIRESGKFVPWNIVKISTDGRVVDF